MQILSRIVVLLGLLSFVQTSFAQTPQAYTDQASFLNAVSGATLIDFEGIAEPGAPVFLGNPGSFTSNGVTITNNSQMFVQNIDSQYGTGSFLSPQGANPQIATIQLPANTVAVGFSYAFIEGASGTFNVGGMGSFVVQGSGFGAMDFFGVVSDTPIDTVIFAVSAAGFDIDDLWFLVDTDPLPSNTYSSEAAFIADAGSATLIDFEGYTEPGTPNYLGNPGEFEESGVRFSNNSQMFIQNIDAYYGTGSFLSPQGANPQVLTIDLPVSTVAVGLSYNFEDYGGVAAVMNVDGQAEYILAEELLSGLGFFGVIETDKPIERLTLTVFGGAFDVDNVWFATNPDVLPTRYRVEADFLAAVENPSLIDFEGIVDPGEFMDFGNGGAYIEAGVRIANASSMFVQNNNLYGTVSYLSPQGATPQTVLIQMPQNTSAVGFSYSSAAATVMINGSEMLQLDAQAVGSLGFLGIVRDTPIRFLEISVAGDYFDMDNLHYVSSGSGAALNTAGGGEIDTGFGIDGVLQLRDLLASDDVDFFGLGVQSGGGIVIAGTKYNDGEDPEVVVARLQLDGQVDTSFGDGGFRSVYVGVGSGLVWDMKILTDGSIVVAGRGDRGTTDWTSYVFKLDVDGDIDTSFASNGVFSENIDTTAGFPTDGFERIVERADGSLLLGTAGLGVHQLTAAGVRDAGFGTSGVAQPNDSNWSSYGLAEAADGKVLFGGGTAFFNSPQGFIVGRYLADGSVLDNDFDSDGVNTAAIGSGNDELLDLIVDDAGRVVVLGYSEQPGFVSYKSAVARFQADGTLDPAFAFDGIRILDGLPLRDLYITRVVQRPDGGYLLSGESLGPLPLPNQEIFLISLHQDGTLDKSFAGRGWQELDVGPDPDDWRLRLLRDAIAIHPAGKIVLLNWRCDCMTMLEAPAWGTSASGDHNGDGRSDVFFRNTATGANQLYLMDGATIQQNLSVSSVAADWTLAGRGDYTGDGKADLLWRHMPTGALWLYEMDGNTTVSSQFVTTVSGADWQIVGNGDYNGDGKADILWHHATNGTVWLYEMDGSTITNSTGVGVVPDTDWQIAGNGDYNGDGKDDILWRNSTSGANWMYLMNGATITSSAGVSVTPDTNWQIVGSGDYDGDGKSDIFWRHAGNGSNWLYRMDGTTIALSTSVSVLPDQNWVVTGEGDYNGDGNSDVLWRNLSTGSNNLYLMDGANILSNTQISTVSDQNWSIAK